MIKILSESDTALGPALDNNKNTNKSAKIRGGHKACMLEDQSRLRASLASSVTIAT